MNKKERVLTALNGNTPDMVPYMYNTVMSGVQEKIIGRKITTPVVDGMNITGWLGSINEKPEVIPSLTVEPEVAKILNLDAIGIQILPPLFVDTVTHDNTLSVSGGQIVDSKALKKVTMPDPDDEKLFRSIEEMIKLYKGDFALYARVRLGAASTILSMGMDNLSYCLVDDEDAVYGTIEMYTEWNKKLFKNLCELDFDFFWSFDDIAYGAGLLFSPSTFKKYFKPYMKSAASAIKRPFIFHSDGNLTSVLDDIIEIGASGLHPIEPGSMDHDWLKATYGDKICLIGNIDIDTVLTNGTPEKVDEEVKYRISQFGHGGGYIISDSNSVPDCCKPENVIAMSKAVEKYRYIY